MKSLPILSLLAACLFAPIVAGFGKDQSGEKIWKEHREAGRDALKSGKYQLAIQEFEQALRATENFPAQDIRRVEALSELANVYVSMRRYEDAASLCEKALALRRNVISLAQLQIEVHLRLQLCEIYSFQEEFAKAEVLLLATQEFLEAQLGAFHPVISQVLSALGSVYLGEKDFSKAETTLKKALKIAEAGRTAHYNVSPGIRLQMDLANEARISGILNQLGMVYAESQNYSASEKHFLRAIKNTESNDSKNSANLTSPLLNLARVYLEKGDAAKAETHLLHAKKIAERHAERSHPVRQDIEKLEAELVKLRKEGTAPSGEKR